MRPRLRAVAVALVGLAVLGAGIAYAQTRTIHWESRGSLFLVPAVRDPFTSSALLDAYQRSGTIGTYVEVVASETLRTRARARAVTLRVRAVPDSRVISLAAEGERAEVQGALARLQRLALRREAAVGDGWELRLGQPASAPARAGASTGLLTLAAVLLAALAALVTAVVLERLFPPAPALPPWAASSGDGDEPVPAPPEYERMPR